MRLSLGALRATVGAGLGPENTHASHVPGAAAGVDASLRPGGLGLSESEASELMGWIKETLKERVSDVETTDRLVESVQVKVEDHESDLGQAGVPAKVEAHVDARVGAVRRCRPCW